MTGLNLQLPDPEVLADVLEGLGIGNDSRVVIYTGTDWVTATTRLLLTLQWFGLGEQASVLDGGLQQWKAAGYAVTSTAPPEPSRATLDADVQDQLVASAEWVRDRLDDNAYAIVDARGPATYEGVRATRLHRQEVRKGHIPGAVNVPFNVLFNDDLTLKPATELEAIFREAGVEPGQTVIGYCHLGQYATAMLLAARSIGHEVVLYDGSFQDWGSRGPEFPVELPESE